MLQPSKDSTIFMLISQIQPVQRSLGTAQFSVDRKLQSETADIILSELALSDNYEAKLSEFVEFTSVLKIAQVDQDVIRYGIHLEFMNPGKINIIRIFKDDENKTYDAYFFTSNGIDADLISLELDTSGGHLPALFECRTGLILSR